MSRVHNNLVKNLVEMNEKKVLSLVYQRLQKEEDPLIILEDCYTGMKVIGEKHERQEYYLSGLIMAGEIFRQVIDIVLPFLEKNLSSNEKGHILLGTVLGDIHDIGKNIFGSMLSSHGFTVTDLGVDVQPESIFEKAEQIRPDIIGLSALITTAYDTMKETVQIIRNSKDRSLAQTPVIIGGGFLNAKICSYVGADYWAVDAMVGVELCKEIMANRE